MVRKPPEPAAELEPLEIFVIDLLARTDALWAPIRDFPAGVPGTIYTRRKSFAAEGIELASRDADASERMTSSRRVTQLVDAALLIRFRPRTRTMRVRFSGTGDSAIRALCDLPSLAHCFEQMFELREIARSTDAINPEDCPAPPQCRLVRECLLVGQSNWIGTEDFAFDLSWLRVTLAPALWREWAAIRCDGHRRAFYHLTESGAAILADSQSDARKKLAETERPPFKPAATSRYWDMFITALEARNTFVDEECRRELGLLPLSCSLPTIRELKDLRSAQRAERRKGKDAAK